MAGESRSIFAAVEKICGFWMFPSYPQISLNDLYGFVEDRNAAKSFDRRCHRNWWIILPFCLGFVGTLALGFFSDSESKFLVFAGLASLCFFAAFFSIYGVILYQTCIKPVDQVSGAPMEIFRLKERGSVDRYELAYVSRPSKTYFRHTFVGPE